MSVVKTCLCNNSIFLNKTGQFRNSKYEDLESLYRTNKEFDLDSSEAKNIRRIFDITNNIFGKEAVIIRSRAFIVSIYLFIEQQYYEDERSIDKVFVVEFKEFILKFINAIKEEVSLGIDAKNRFLISFQARIIQGADSKSSITYRHDHISEAFNYFHKTAKIIGY